MGTRGIVNVTSSGNPDKILVSIYSQYDSYPSGLGEDIKKALHDGNTKIINGIGGAEHQCPSYFNGMECLAAYLVKSLKCGIGGIYLYSPGQTEEYNYTLYNKGADLYLKVISSYSQSKILFDDLLAKFDSKLIGR